MKRLVTFAAVVLFALVAPLAAQARPRQITLTEPIVIHGKIQVRTLADMIRAGRYDVVDAYVAKRHVRVKPKLFTTNGVKAIRFDREISTEEALGELFMLKLRAPTIETQLAYGAEHPEEQREHQIVALGSGYYSLRPHRWFMATTLGVYPTGERVLGFDWGVAPNHKWKKGTVFLAVPK